MTDKEILAYLKEYLTHKINNVNDKKIELVVTPMINLTWGMVVSYLIKEPFETNGIPIVVSTIFFDKRLNKIVKLKKLISTHDGKIRRISTKFALELYRKDNDLSLLNKEQYQDIINATCLASYTSEYFLWENFCNEYLFEELLEMVENYKCVTKDCISLDKATIANIYSIILDLESKQTDLKIPIEKRELMQLNQKRLKLLMEELVWKGIKRVDYYTGEVWYGVNKR